MKPTLKYVLIGAAALAVIAGTAVGSSLITRDSMEPAQPQRAAVVHHAAPRQQVATTQPARPACDDHNIVGTLGGAVAGGLVGAQFGKGNGRGVATAGGAVAGGALGNAYIPTRGATCN